MLNYPYRSITPYMSYTTMDYMHTHTHSKLPFPSLPSISTYQIPNPIFSCSRTHAYMQVSNTAREGSKRGVRPSAHIHESVHLASLTFPSPINPHSTFQPLINSHSHPPVSELAPEHRPPGSQPHPSIYLSIHPFIPATMLPSPSINHSSTPPTITPHLSRKKSP